MKSGTLEVRQPRERSRIGTFDWVRGPSDFNGC